MTRSWDANERRRGSEFGLIRHSHRTYIRFACRVEPPVWPTWQIDNVTFKPEHIGQVFGAMPNPVPRTPSLWVRWPTIWRKHTTGLSRRLPLVCSMPGTWTDAENAFALLAGQPLTREQFCTHGAAAYTFILKRKWDSSLPDNKEAATDVMRAALGVAFTEILDDYVFVDTLMEWKKYTFADALKDYPRARLAFDDFTQLTNWIHAVARHRVRVVMRGIEQPQPVESTPSHLRRKRLRANGECPWCWSSVIERPVPLRGNRICAYCQIALPRGVWISFTETVCKKRAADPAMGPAVPTRVQLDERRSWPRFTGPRTVPPSLERIADEDGTPERIAKRDAEVYAGRDLIMDGRVIPLRATARQLWEEDDWCATRSRRRDARREGIRTHLRDDDEPRRITNRPHGVGVQADRDAQWTGNGVVAEAEGFTAPASRVHARDGALSRVREELRISLKLEASDGAAREL